MSNHRHQQSWADGHNLATAHSVLGPAITPMSSSSIPPGRRKFDMDTIQSTIAFSDEYDDLDLMELPGAGANNSDFPGSPLGMSSSATERAIRRRSSKACDQCRKSKCKCERSSQLEPCKNCIILGTQCTFLGPSRKRGPPKGYIDAIEARLHQAEALVGILIALNDDRAQSLLGDLAMDPMAREIIKRVDNSVYGVKGRSSSAAMKSGAKTGKGHSKSISSESERSVDLSGGVGMDGQTMKVEQEQIDLHATHPTNEWQDRVVALLSERVQQQQISHTSDGSSRTARDLSNNENSISSDSNHTVTAAGPYPSTISTNIRNGNDTHSRNSSTMSYASSSRQQSPSRRQRRRVEQDGYSGSLVAPCQQQRGYTPSSGASGSPAPHTTSPTSPQYGQANSGMIYAMNAPMRDEEQMQMQIQDQGAQGSASCPPGESMGDEEEDEVREWGDADGDVVGAVGQLSLNEDEQVRYHGKASGLHLLGMSDRRNEGGIWRFPKARVWPPLPADAPQRSVPAVEEDEFISNLPERSVQDHLLEIYFTYVHSSFPVIHKQAFFEVYNNGGKGYESHESPGSDSHSHSSSSSSPFKFRRRPVPTLLLLAMFAIAARFSSGAYTPPPPADESVMWAAGDEYLDRAKVILDSTYSSPRPATVQALLLMGYREVGIGAMAQAWTYIGMAIRMAQDLGMHRSADKWARVGLGGRLFGQWELHERKRIWYACCIMDKYVSSYIGRPLGIFNSDFDTPLPEENDPEEFEEWSPHSSLPIDDYQWGSSAAFTTAPVAGRIISCFNASATLCKHLGSVAQGIYAIHPAANRHKERTRLEGLLDKWLFELPEHLRYEHGNAKQPVPGPHILTLHMQYWCAVLLLQRPFIRPFENHNLKHSETTDKSDDGDFHGIATRSYELCAAAANHISSIVSVYLEHHCLKRSAVFLCYYIFTASIMHVTILTSYPTDPQARLGLKKCMEALSRMKIVWPSAGRALELLRGCKVNLDEPELANLSNHPDRHKRGADQTLDDQVALERGRMTQNAVDYASAMSAFDSAGYDDQDLYGGAMQGNASGAVSPTFPSYERWPTDGGGDGSIPPFPSTLSTSVLPQLYSTGLVDDRRRLSADAARVHSSGSRSQVKYPQYWNDFSAFPQLGAAYNAGPGLAVPRQSRMPTTFVPTGFDIYDNPPHM